uniref:BTB domain-containing protein n=1 Tax=Haemonchus placei TaxID=6290 RepID=A0A0N4WLD5_HAEPC
LERMRYQRETGRFCDVCIVVKDRQFSAHRNILASCSPYFDSILRSTKVTKEQVIVNCQQPKAFELLLNYMYSGCVVIDRTTVAELLRLANNFLVTKLKNYCAEYLDRYLDAANSLSVRQLATRYNLPALLKAASEYFDVNINRCLLESLDILKYPMPQLLKILEDPKYQDVISPDVYLKLIVRWVGEDVPSRESSFRSLLERCHIPDVSDNALEFVLDYSPLLTKSQTCRHMLLSELYRYQISIGKDSVNLNINANLSVMANPGLRKEDDLKELTRLRVILPMMDDDDLDGVYATSSLAGAVTYTEEDAFDPEEVEDGEDLHVDGGPHTCKFCKFASTSEVEKHRARQHNRNTAYLCQLCDYEATWSKSFYNHCREHWLELPMLIEVDSSFFTFQSVDLATDRFFKCLECNFRARTRTQLWAHERMHSSLDERPLHCEECGRGFNTHTALEMHFSSHDEPRSMVCEDCGFATSNADHMTSHRRQHTGDMFYCHIDNCDYSSPKKSQLAAHLRTHMAVRAHMCKICGRGFIEKSHLVRHERIHLEDKPFKCDACDYASSRRDKLKEHILKHHNGTMVNKSQRRRYRRAKQLAALTAQVTRNFVLDLIEWLLCLFDSFLKFSSEQKTLRHTGRDTLLCSLGSHRSPLRQLQFRHKYLEAQKRCSPPTLAYISHLSPDTFESLDWMGIKRLHVNLS